MITNQSFQHSSKHRHPYFFSLVAALCVVLIGTLGYYFIEGWSALDSLYMTVISLTTVGYSEVTPLSDQGKLFTMVLLLLGIGVAAYAIGTGFRFIVEGEVQLLRGTIRMHKKIDSLKNHHIICGFGRLGSIVVKDFVETGESILVLDKDPKHIEELERIGVPYIIGNAYEDESLKSARIDDAKTLLTLLSSDADNVYVALCARDLNPRIAITARTDHEEGERRLRRAGANNIIAPYRVSGSRLVQRILRPHVTEFLELATSHSGMQLVIEEIQVPENSVLAGRSLQETDLRNRTGAVIAASILRDGTMTYNPGASSLIAAGSTLVVLGERKALEKLSEIMAEEI